METKGGIPEMLGAKQREFYAPLDGRKNEENSQLSNLSNQVSAGAIQQDREKQKDVQVWEGRKK